MNEFSSLRGRLPGMLKALTIGVPAGYLLARLDTPILWMIGPMVAVATVNLMGIRAHAVPYTRQMGQVILGSAVSLYFTPPVVAALAANLGAIVAATIAAFVIGALGALILSQVSGVEEKSTFFASIPSGAMAMAVFAQRHGAQIAPVAVAHSLRVWETFEPWNFERNFSVAHPWVRRSQTASTRAGFPFLTCSIARFRAGFRSSAFSNGPSPCQPIERASPAKSGSGSYRSMPI